MSGLQDQPAHLRPGCESIHSFHLMPHRRLVVGYPITDARMMMGFQLDQNSPEVCDYMAQRLVVKGFGGVE